MTQPPAVRQDNWKNQQSSVERQREKRERDLRDFVPREVEDENGQS